MPDGYWKVSRTNRRNISRPSRPASTRPRTSDELPNGSQTRLDHFSHWSQDSLPSRTVLWCESWWCVSIATRSRSSTLYCCKAKQTCIWHEWRSQTLVEHPWQSSVSLWHGSYARWSMLQSVVFYTVVWANLETKNSTRCHDAAFEENAGSHCRMSGCRKIRGRNYWPFCGWCFPNRWNRNGTSCLGQTQKGFPSWFARLERGDLHKTKTSFDEGSIIRAVHWG